MFSFSFCLRCISLARLAWNKRSMTLRAETIPLAGSLKTGTYFRPLMRPGKDIPSVRTNGSICFTKKECFTHSQGLFELTLHPKPLRACRMAPIAAHSLSAALRDLESAIIAPPGRDCVNGWSLLQLPALIHTHTVASLHRRGIARLPFTTRRTTTVSSWGFRKHERAPGYSPALPSCALPAILISSLQACDLFRDGG
jgi:hypothetical protein